MGRLVTGTRWAEAWEDQYEVDVDGEGKIRTWTKAVAIKTPVPKCLQKKNIVGGILRNLNFFATTGKPAPKQEKARTRTLEISHRCELMWVLNNYSQRPMTCNGKSYFTRGRPWLPHMGFDESMADSASPPLPYAILEARQLFGVYYPTQGVQDG
jgi:hypothetical protein